MISESKGPPHGMFDRQRWSAKVWRRLAGCHGHRVARRMTRDASLMRDEIMSYTSYRPVLPSKPSKTESLSDKSASETLLLGQWSGNRWRTLDGVSLDSTHTMHFGL